MQDEEPVAAIPESAMTAWTREMDARPRRDERILGLKSFQETRPALRPGRRFSAIDAGRRPRCSVEFAPSGDGRA